MICYGTTSKSDQTILLSLSFDEACLNNDETETRLVRDVGQRCEPSGGLEIGDGQRAAPLPLLSPQAVCFFLCSRFLS